MKKTLKAFKLLFLILGCFTGITFLIYIMNWDMKAASFLQERIQPFYDHRKRNNTEV